MRIAIDSASPAVSRTLSRIITLANHTVASLHNDADLILRDIHHPSAASKPTRPLLLLDSPWQPHQLIQRLMVWQTGQSLALQHGWSLDVASRRLMHEQNEAIALTEKESGLLFTLIAAHPVACTREAVLEKVWGIGTQIDTHTLETHIYRLRGKLSALPNPPGDIMTEGGAYRWQLKFRHG